MNFDEPDNCLDTFACVSDKLLTGFVLGERYRPRYLSFVVSPVFRLHTCVDADDEATFLSTDLVFLCTALAFVQNLQESVVRGQPPSRSIEDDPRTFVQYRA